MEKSRKLVPRKGKTLRKNMTINRQHIHIQIKILQINISQKRKNEGESN